MKINEIDVVLMVFELLVGAWYLIAWKTSEAFWGFLTQPVVMAVIFGSLISGELYAAILTLEDILRNKKSKT